MKDFAACPRLTELYLRKNDISDLSEIHYLLPLKHLRVLWLWDNPCASSPNYRLTVIKFLPHLAKLDNTEITEEERNAAQNFNAAFNAEDNLYPEKIISSPKNQPRKHPESPKRESPSKDHIEPHPQIRQEVDPPKKERIEPSRELIKKKSEPLSGMKRLDPDERPLTGIGRGPKKIRAPALQRDDNDDPKENRNENILCAVLALTKELDVTSLELLKRNIEKKISQKKT